jgi:SnoaL-like domain
MSDRDAILFANEAFYLAISNRDIRAMQAVWASEGPLACIHPGWAALVNRGEVIDSWRRILSHDSAPKIVCREPQVLLLADVAVVICYEDIEGQLLVATNVFRREGRNWLMIHHQAGPTVAELASDGDTEGPAKPN